MKTAIERNDMPRYIVRQSVFGYWFVKDTQDVTPIGTVLMHGTEVECRAYLDRLNRNEA